MSLRLGLQIVVRTVVPSYRATGTGCVGPSRTIHTRERGALRTPHENLPRLWYQRRGSRFSAAAQVTSSRRGASSRGSPQGQAS